MSTLVPGPVSMDDSGGTVITRVPVPATVSATRCSFLESAPDMATSRICERVCSSTWVASSSVPSTGTEEMRRCFLAGSSSMIPTGTYSESGSCIMRWMMNVPDCPAP